MHSLRTPTPKQTLQVLCLFRASKHLWIWKSKHRDLSPYLKVMVLGLGFQAYGIWCLEFGASGLRVSLGFRVWRSGVSFLGLGPRGRVK